MGIGGPTAPHTHSLLIFQHASESPPQTSQRLSSRVFHFYFSKGPLQSLPLLVYTSWPLTVKLSKQGQEVEARPQVERGTRTATACTVTPPSSDVLTGALKMTLMPSPEKSALLSCFIFLSFFLSFLQKNNPHYFSQGKRKRRTNRTWQKEWMSRFLSFLSGGKWRAKRGRKIKGSDEGTDEQIAPERKKVRPVPGWGSPAFNQRRRSCQLVNDGTFPGEIIRLQSGLSFEERHLSPAHRPPPLPNSPTAQADCVERPDNSSHPCGRVGQHAQSGGRLPSRLLLLPCKHKGLLPPPHTFRCIPSPEGHYLWLWPQGQLADLPKGRGPCLAALASQHILSSLLWQPDGARTCCWARATTGIYTKGKEN